MAAAAPSQVVVRILLALLVAIAAGFWGLVTLFSDPSPDWSYKMWALYLVAGHVLAGFVIGLLLPLRWQLSIAAAWGALFMGVAFLLATVRSAGLDAEAPLGSASPLSFPILVLLVLPAATALGGYWASRVVAAGRRPTALPSR